MNKKTGDERTTLAIEAREAAERVVEGMEEGARKDKAFEMAFARFLDGSAVSKPKSSSRRKGTGSAPSSERGQSKQSRRSKGPLVHTKALVASKFFDSPRDVAAVTARLRQNGHKYEPKHVATTLLRLIREDVLTREAAKGNRGRDVWMYKKV